MENNGSNGKCRDITKLTDKKREFLKLYPSKGCNVSATCEGVGISRTIYYEWLKCCDEFRIEIGNCEERLIDKAESKLHENIDKGKEVSLLFYLKCKAKHRGYIEKSEVEHGGKVEIKIDIDDDN